MKKLLARHRIMIVDDHPMMRDGLSMRIAAQSDLEVCGEAAAEDEAMELFKQVCPDLVIVDISLKSGDGIELIKRIKARNSTVKVLVISAFQESLYAERAMRAGALGYLNKQETNEKLIDAIRAVINGERFASFEMTQRLVSQALGKRSDTQASRNVSPLRNKELQMLQLPIACLVIALIAAILGFGGIAGSIAGIAQIVFVIFLVLAVPKISSRVG